MSRICIKCLQEGIKVIEEANTFHSCLINNVMQATFSHGDKYIVHHEIILRYNNVRPTLDEVILNAHHF